MGKSHSVTFWHPSLAPSYWPTEPEMMSSLLRYHVTKLDWPANIRAGGSHTHPYSSRARDQSDKKKRQSLGAEWTASGQLRHALLLIVDLGWPLSNQSDGGCFILTRGGDPQRLTFYGSNKRWTKKVIAFIQKVLSSSDLSVFDQSLKWLRARTLDTEIICSSKIIVTKT